ncbi:nickel-dependent lactate racemase [Crateriforma conspicua]|uniref:Uncharacterized protein n=1 Tax=Crateriforma conspicua TaxID=2527996 RepID=A0A5C6FVS7_9PLAN|nr:nickel-dependent lactate racemase [Crateriforma conspicua]TWU65735.1 hypothetical protein V7x_12840 [Crateriforma conspicua]
MPYRLNYGRGHLEISVPSECIVTEIRKPAMPVLQDADGAIAEALDTPRGCESLTQLAGKATSACIAICDITRPVPNGLFLQPMIRRIMAAGIDASNITVLVATGLHRPNLGDELEELLGDAWVRQNVQVVNHEARDDQQHVHVGTTRKRSTVVRLDRRFVEADLKIVTGLVEPHFMAGYSGGRKVIAPGLAHQETITTFHNHRFMSDPAARNCNFDQNPLHEDQLEILQMLGDVYALNTVIDEQRRLSFVNFGECLQSHAGAVQFVQPFCEIVVPRRFKTVVTSAAGYPLDKTYYQTIKGMVAAMNILAPGGDLIIASQCSEGMGSPEFVNSQKQLLEMRADTFLNHIAQQSHADIDQWQTQMQTKPMSIGRVHLYSDGIPDQHRALTCVDVVSSVDDAIAESVQRHQDRHVAIIPEGPYVVPFCEQDVMAHT